MQGRRDQLVQQEVLAQRATQDRRAPQDLLVRQVVREPLAQQVPLDPLARPETQAPQVQRACKAILTLYRLLQVLYTRQDQCPFPGWVG